ncbi:hypothetical protein ON003_03715 [Janibacter hoylei]|uniref:hypothetical protein n=1 Tax=Janibacter hoylei TaxID=364298 RepID=UPI0022370759|nr:hypothetical protein [Janibacter hoylei]MCW4600808.1 hypothetical protein [Janibacter hoylei]
MGSFDTSRTAPRGAVGFLVVPDQIYPPDAYIIVRDDVFTGITLEPDPDLPGLDGVGHVIE